LQWEQDQVSEAGDAVIQDEGEEAAGGWRRHDDDEEQGNGDKKENGADEVSIHYTRRICRKCSLKSKYMMLLTIWVSIYASFQWEDEKFKTVTDNGASVETTNEDIITNDVNPEEDEEEQV
jgi:hypothetical protein